MKLNNFLARVLRYFLVHSGFLIPIIFAFFVNPRLFSGDYITGVNFPRAILAFSCILGACLFGIGCLRYKRNEKGAMTNYAGFGFYLFIGSFVGIYLLISRVAF